MEIYDARFLAYLMSNIVEIWLIIISSHFQTKYDGTAPNVKTIILKVVV